jgi:hypothetical protein
MAELRRVADTLPADKLVSCLSVRVRSLKGMRTRDDIDAELRLLVAVRQSVHEQDGDPPSRQIDELLDERGMASDV